MLWVTYRQHRWLVLATVVLVAWMALFPGWAVLTYPLLGLIAALFWGAPLVSREYEEHTHVFAWTQDLSPARWLAGKVLALGAVLTLLALVLALASLPRQYSWETFELGVFPQLGYAWFGFALGIAASVVLRRTVVAMGVTLLGFAVTRVVLARWGREHYLSPVHTWRPDPPPGVDYEPQLPPGGMWVASGYADKNGDPMPVPLGCDGDDACLTAKGQIGHFVDYQPLDRVVPFQLIEFAIFLVLALVSLFVAFTTLRRAARPRPTGNAAGTPAPAESGSSTRFRATDPAADSAAEGSEPR
jgi:hypothetical protein